ncbi:MAG TPA: glycosyltransferase family 39 protein [Candidatus Sulfotelmatobacter sp.]|nr:glycosyltransferase family 39 protein [Candidatus Sulfotelmatobacter sp.]
MTNRTRADVLLLAGFCAFLFFYGLGQFGLVGADEPRYAQVAREMLERRDWVTPALGGQPWLEKPPLYYWQAMVSYSLYGVSDKAARVPSAFDATILVLAVYLFLRRFRPGVELDGALITASCAGVVGFARAAGTDMPLASTFSIAMLAWWAWRENGKRAYLAAFYFFLALGMLAKGPVAPFLGALIIVFYAAAAREFRVIVKTLWLPGIVLFCAISLPWYGAVQMRNPEFFHVFFLQHNLERFSSNLYHHRAPLWYYLPVTLLALAPWTVFALTAFVESARLWWAERSSVPTGGEDRELQFRKFLSLWLALPIVFFSISQSKLPGYVLPAIPAGALLLADYLRQHLRQEKAEAPPKALVVMHALLAGACIVPALLAGYLATQHHLPRGRAMFGALGFGLVLAAGVALTLFSRAGLRTLRFVTLIPVVLAVAAVLKIGSTSLDQSLSARPLAREIASVESHSLPLAVFGVRREVEYGLAFYRNQVIVRYEKGSVPAEGHLLVAPENSQLLVSGQLADRRVLLLGHFAPQHVDYYWITASASSAAR